MAAAAPVVKGIDYAQEWGLNLQYSKDRFEIQVKAKGLDLLHFYSFHGQQSAERLFQTKKSWISPRINYRDPCNYHVTPLMLTVIIGNQQWAELLLISGSELTLQDDHGFTALHWAALQGRKEFDQLVALIQKVRKSTQEVFYLKSKADQTCYDVLSMIQGTLPFIKEQSVTCQGAPVTPALFQRLTGRKFLQGFLATPKQILDMNGKNHIAEEKTIVERICGQRLPQALLIFLRNPPSLQIFWHPIKQWCLRSHSLIEPYQYVCIYAGESMQGGDQRSIREKKIYACDSVSAHKAGNWGSLIGDGPPNVMYMKGPGAVGDVVVALRSIQKGEEISANYGAPHIVKMGKYTISDKQMTYVKEWYPRYFQWTQDLVKACESSEILKWEGAVRYTLSTPYAFVRFLLDGIFKPQDMLQLLQGKSPQLSATAVMDNLCANNETVRGLRLVYQNFSQLLCNSCSLSTSDKQLFQNKLQQLISDYTMTAAMMVLSDALLEVSIEHFLSQLDWMLQAAGLLDQINIIAKGSLGVTYIGMESDLLDQIQNSAFDENSFDALPCTWQNCVRDYVVGHLEWFNQQEKTILESGRRLFNERKSQLVRILERPCREDQKT
ncbi:MAG: hypothetical protein A3D96_02710 [Chlamydiae bacterium RIFCSPHIGHO2_12_FULL_44_59]|nr:MAG: hypothetical protein A2796_07060 [Chlamydiae bacterium RIFCSPHIGHO2_01_FULL_44_39]OGN57036.1 MAG: hypothetical protein A3C42_05565 [Chlamydiae bacterium RIFCSPHIGHO2_02_FULL_45_9]OGN60995.1 MAG: hypothetical protein A3D96_02710 [Chlamydiae bacterium RIFCSPHIGHO2_12_FULL_44_59]OGN66771.1 MAG: hypothetical protein A2978_00195 [Chlamydiae bacterium RIFCSPLOWO2_01_FULL_44_52]OGN69965.1 MAG: hypothetical protein A3I67_01510 [Chlamydiae bacterium RIFCSPLOWO2_02_FULL_45_22]OGN71036.1 MAG: hyp